MIHRYRRLKRGCYCYSLTTAALLNLSPVLFLTLHNAYGLSYSALATLISINFLTQLGVDLLFSYRPQWFDIPKLVRTAPLVAALGLVLYGLMPLAFPDRAWLGLALGTVVFSAAGGLAEVLLSPVIAAIPAPDPDREMSGLHSAYAWGVGPVVLGSTAFLHCFGQERWFLLPLLFTAIPLCAYGLLRGAAFPPITTGSEVPGKTPLKNATLWLCVAGIFFGGAAENTMAQWASGYLELALGIPKVWGDVAGVAMFSVMLGTGRTLYSKYGTQVERFLIAGSLGAVGCYLTAVFSPVPAVGLLACALTGLCVSLLWPGSLIVAANRVPRGGVILYALMAAGGDLGSSVVPQLLGLVTDVVAAQPGGSEALGMKVGMALGSLAPLMAAVIFWKLSRQRKNP